MYPSCVDTVKDFAGVSRVASVPNLLVVSPALGVKTVKDLIALAKSKPGQINFSRPASAAARDQRRDVQAAAGIECDARPYKGAVEFAQRRHHGQGQFTFSPVLVAAGQVKAGRALALAVSTARRSAMFPDLPTVAEAGIPGFEYDQWYGLLAAAKTPRPVIHIVNKEVVRILNLPDIKERMLTQGATPTPTSPAEFDAFIRSEVKRFAKVLIAAGARTTGTAAPSCQPEARKNGVEIDER